MNSQPDMHRESHFSVAFNTGWDCVLEPSSNRYRTKMAIVGTLPVVSYVKRGRAEIVDLLCFPALIVLYAFSDRY